MSKRAERIKKDIDILKVLSEYGYDVYEGEESSNFAVIFMEMVQIMPRARGSTLSLILSSASLAGKQEIALRLSWRKKEWIF